MLSARSCSGMYGKDKRNKRHAVSIPPAICGVFRLVRRRVTTRFYVALRGALSKNVGRFCLFAAPQETWEKGQLVRSAELNIFRPPHSYSRQAEQKYSSRYVQTVVSTGRVHAPAGLFVGPRTIRTEHARGTAAQGWRLLRDVKPQNQTLSTAGCGELDVLR